jgi:hypothetical protein
MVERAMAGTASRLKLKVNKAKSTVAATVLKVNKAKSTVAATAGAKIPRL